MVFFYACQGVNLIIFGSEQKNRPDFSGRRGVLQEYRLFIFIQLRLLFALYRGGYGCGSYTSLRGLTAYKTCQHA